MGFFYISGDISLRGFFWKGLFFLRRVAFLGEIVQAVFFVYKLDNRGLRV